MNLHSITYRGDRHGKHSRNTRGGSPFTLASLIGVCKNWCKLNAHTVQPSCLDLVSKHHRSSSEKSQLDGSLSGTAVFLDFSHTGSSIALRDVDKHRLWDHSPRQFWTAGDTEAQRDQSSSVWPPTGRIQPPRETAGLGNICQESELTPNRWNRESRC